jgi:hypothetical protein
MPLVGHIVLIAPGHASILDGMALWRFSHSRSGNKSGMLNVQKRRASARPWAVVTSIGLTLLLAACSSNASGGGSTSTTEHIAQQGSESKSKPSLVLSNRSSSSSVVVTSVFLPEGGGPGDGGWVVVGTDDSGKIGSVLGKTQVQEGASQNITVRVNPPLPDGTYLVGLYRGKNIPRAGVRSLTLKPLSIPTS